MIALGFSLLFEMERPAAVLAAVELALLVDGIVGKGQTTSAVRIWGSRQSCAFVLL